MKIAIIVYRFPPKWLGGTEIATYNMAKYLSKNNDVTIITSLDEHLPNENFVDGFNIYRIPLLRWRFIENIFFLYHLVLILNKINPDIIHIQDIKMGIYGIFTKIILRKPFIVWGQGSDIYTQWQFKYLISKYVLKNSDKIIALTKDMCIEIKKLYDKQVFIIPNGIEIKRFKYLSKENSRKIIGLLPDKYIITFVGTLRPIKGVKYLMYSIKIIKDLKIDFKVLIIGDGQDRTKLELLAKKLDITDFVEFIGRISNDNINTYMAASDVFVLPSLSEGFPVVILEAMASGLPIITTNVKGLPEIVKNYENGFTVEPKDPQKLANRILLLMENNKLSNKISGNNKQKAIEYDWAKVTQLLENIYQI
ncbi:MAG: glycosyltransferase family 4 protein [Methanobacterium sp.]